MILPEDVINEYKFEQPSPIGLKEYLINYYNSLTLHKYKEQQQFLTAKEIYQHMPNKIIDFYTQHNKVPVQNKNKNNLRGFMPCFNALKFTNLCEFLK